MELRQYIELFRRWVWLVILGLVLGVAGGYGASTFQEPVYQASTRVMVSRAPDQNSTYSSFYDDQNLAQTYIQLLTTQPVLSKTGETLGYPVSRGQINAQLVRDTSLISVTVTDTNPQHTADVANTIVQVLIEQNDTIQSGRFADSEESLNVQLKDIEAQIIELQTNIAAQSQTSLNTQKEQVKQQIEDVETQILAIQKEIIAISPVVINPQQEIVLSSNQANQLKEKELKLQLLQSTLTFYQDTYLKLSSGSVQVASSNGAQMDQMQNNLNLYQNIYTNLLNSYEEMRLARLRNTPNVVQVEAAMPSSSPIRPRPMTNAGLGGAVGLMLAAGVVFLIEYLDDTIKSPEDAADILQLPVIGYIPEMKKSKDQEEGYVHVAEEPRSPVTESFRSLRTNLEFSQVDKPLRSIMITSPSPTEGKSTLAANLALIMSQSGKRVLLIDADMRRPKLHRILTVSNRVGLSDIFLNHRTAQAISRIWRDSQMTVITSGPLPPNPNELLASQKMAQFLEQLKEVYDIVIFDSPPILVADATVLASLVDGVLLVLNPGQTKKDAARATVEQVHRVGSKVVGIVFNRIPRHRSDYYGGYRHYSQYYSRGYKDYYSEGNSVSPKTRKHSERRNGQSPEKGAQTFTELDKGSKI